MKTARECFLALSRMTASSDLFVPSAAYLQLEAGYAGDLPLTLEQLLSAFQNLAKPRPQEELPLLRERRQDCQRLAHIIEMNATTDCVGVTVEARAVFRAIMEGYHRASPDLADAKYASARREFSELDVNVLGTTLVRRVARPWDSREPY